MRSKKKALLNAALFFLVFGLTVYGVFHGEDMARLLEALKTARPAWLIPAVGCVFLFIAGEAVILRWMMGSCGVHLRPGRFFLFSSVGFFFSAVTPSAGGGQPMQVYFMRKEDIPIPISAVTLMTVTITYKLVLVAIAFGIILFARDFLHVYLGRALFLFYLGTALTVTWVTLLLILVFHPSLARKILVWGLGLLEKLHILRRREERLERLTASMEQYGRTAVFFKRHIPLLLGVLLVTFVQRTALFSVTWFAYKSLGLEGTGFLTVIILQASISICADMLPLPGGMGISEGVFLKIFAPVFGAMALPGMVLSRGISYYSQLLISAVFTAAAAALLGRNDTQKERNEG